MRLAVYLDELHDDPALALDALPTSWTSICVRSAWGRKIDLLTAEHLRILATLIRDKGKHAVLVASECTALGKVEQMLQFCQVLGCKALRTVPDFTSPQLADWFRAVSSSSLAADVVPVLEPGFMCWQKPTDLALLLAGHRRWQLIYDPASLTDNGRRTGNTFVQYWSLFKQRVAFLDIRDYRRDAGRVPPGLGDGQLDLILSDTAHCGYKGWVCLEFGLGSRLGGVTGKDRTFKMGLQALNVLIERLGLAHEFPNLNDEFERSIPTTAPSRREEGKGSTDAGRERAGRTISN